MVKCQHSSVKFLARIWLDKPCDGISSIDVWVHELESLVAARSSKEWVECHLAECCDRDTFADLLPAGSDKSKRWQILVNGTLRGFWTSGTWGEEWEEECDFDEVQCSEVPDDFAEEYWYK